MRQKTLVASLLLALFVVGCGGGSEGGTSAGAVGAGARGGAPSPGAVAAADAICVQMIARSGRLGDELSAETHSGSGALALTTQLMKPAIPIVETSSRRLRELKREAVSSGFDAYVNLFDPILALLRERIAAGEAGDATQAHDLEQQLVEMIDLQRSLAKQAGLEACDVDFIKAFASRGLTQ